MYDIQGRCNRAYLRQGSENEYLPENERTVERSVNPQNVRMACGKIKAMVETDETGRKKITKIIEDKY